MNNEELKEYESIEENNEDINSILIKRFKFRVSALKNYKVSEEIVICDNYEFDLNSLSHTDSLIKIAIVKDNIDNWLNSENIVNYDFIFTINDNYIDLLKKFNENVFFTASFSNGCM